MNEDHRPDHPDDPQRQALRDAFRSGIPGAPDDALDALARQALDIAVPDAHGRLNLLEAAERVLQGPLGQRVRYLFPGAAPPGPAHASEPPLGLKPWQRMSWSRGDFVPPPLPKSAAVTPPPHLSAAEAMTWIRERQSKNGSR